ncbi:cilia- and flagella-associated protein 47 [Saccopteryx leptura]|uniref:cilia- and flagella-associated protein 47 n=1 Tax=Saccopteryx leptura TaxID=249018 RepID=UPI00339CE9A4
MGTPRGSLATPRASMSTPRGSLMTPRASVSIPRGSLTTPRASMSTPSGSLIALDVATPKELQLRVTPMELKFLDTQAGKMYRQTMTIQNLGPCNQKIRFLDPVKPQFNLNMTSLDKELASGLQMTAVVEYHPDVDEDTFDQLIIVVGNKAMEIPLIGLIPNCQLEIVPEVNFGILVANSKVHSKEIRIVNRGMAPGTFKTDYQGQLPIAIFPSSGIVNPRSSTIVQVDFCADEPRVVNEVAKVSLEGRPIKYLKIKVSVVEQILELLNMTDDKKVECIRFGSAYFGTSKFEYALLYNNSPAPINWVAIIQNDAFGESGTNIHQRTDVAINNLTYFRKIKDIDITTFISCVPNEGRLLPYEKIKITFCFSPKLIVEGKKDDDPSHRQDYAVFLRFDSVGSKDGFLRDDNSKTVKNDQFEKFELALTGSGFPVVLQFDLGNILHFPPCNIGQSSKITFYMENRSKVLPVTYHYKKTANFKVEPERGKVDAGCMQTPATAPPPTCGAGLAIPREQGLCSWERSVGFWDIGSVALRASSAAAQTACSLQLQPEANMAVRITCSFIPHQFGVFEVKQYIEFIGPVADKTLRSLTQQAFHQIYLLFKTVCIASPKEVVMKINPGISPYITNPTGQFMVKDLVKCERCAPVAMLQSDKTTIHDHRSSKGSVSNALIAFPNDRAGSVRSTDQDKYFRTIFTKTPRHHYVDPDYAYTNYELLEKKGNENYYNDYIRNMRLEKQARRDDAEFAETVLYQVSGLQSPTLSLAELKDEPCSSSEHKLEPYQLLCTSDIESKEAEAVAREVHEGLKPYPSTPQETRDCTLMLSPRQIHQVIIGPAVLNFGDICVNSINNRPLHVVNMLSSHVFIKFDVNLKELKKTKQLSYVIPPSSSAYIPMIFQSPNAGKFWKSFTFTVNSIPGGHILVVADVLPVRLELSSKEVVLKPHGFFLKTCFRDTVTLYNHQNYVARFEWIPAYTKIIGFFIRPNQGSVEPYSSLKCEVVWIPGFSSPERGGFVLRIDEGDSEALKCIAQPGNSKVVFLEPRIFFNNIPQGLTTSKRIVLHNVGQNHAYFKVCQKSLLPIINIIPSEGVIPLGGQFVLNICCTPTIADKFETVAKVDVYHAETIDLRIGGISEFPEVEITPDLFNFGGTYINGTQTFPFLVKNKGIARVRVEFNLENRQYFSMDFKDTSGHCLSFIIALTNCRLVSERAVYLFVSPRPLDTTLRVRIPSSLFLGADDSSYSLSASFPEGRTIKGSPKGINAALTCRLIFKSSKPMSFFTGIFVCDSNGNKFLLPVTATVENCILSYYPFMAVNYTEKIVIRNGIEETPENLDLDKNETSEKEENKSMENEKKNQLLSEQEKMTENFYQKVVRATEIWFTLFGWPEGPHYLFIPESIRSTQGAYFAHILPEFLLEPGDYKIWHELKNSSTTSSIFSALPEEKNAVVLNAIEFETWSKRAWTDLFLQMYKVAIGRARIQVQHPDARAVFQFSATAAQAEGEGVSHSFTAVNSVPQAYKRLDAALATSWGAVTGTIPPGRWILNFDEDLSDGLVFAALLAAYCPFLIEAHFVNMYTEPKCFEQRFHNSLIIVNSFHDIGFSTGIEAPDICEPNPIQMLMLCVYMYERLPSYLPRKLLMFHCTLHETATKHILVKNPSSTPLGYTTRIIGRDAADFSVSLTGSMVTIPPKDGRSNLEYDKDAFQAPRILRTSIRSSFIREYFCSTPVLHMQVGKPMYLELCFVPFDMETRYCIIILSNKNIGELVYAVEGTGVIPLPSVLPAMMSRTSHTYDCKNTPEVVHEEEPVLYLKCKPKHMLSVNLILPLMNEAKEKALAFAAKQQMSDVEYQRRSITGTLESSSVRVAIALLGLTRVETSLLFNISKLRKPKSILYTTELSLPGFFSIPKEIHIPQYKEILTKELKPSHPEVPDDSFVVSLHFFPLTPGRYPCRILLTSKYDVRLFYLEGIVSDERPEATFEFETPAFKAITQNIPIINKTRDEWRCHVIIEGDYFSGPSDLTLKPGETMQYPLTFEPALECEIMGKVTVQNILDGMEHIVAMKGIGRKPVALEHIIANCKVGVPECRTIIVPNNTKQTVTLKVSSNLPIVWGKQKVTIEPNDTARYILHINSGKRGAFHGKLLFSIESTNHDDSENKLDHDEDLSIKTSKDDDSEKESDHNDRFIKSNKDDDSEKESDPDEGPSLKNNKDDDSEKELDHDEDPSLKNNKDDDTEKELDHDEDRSFKNNKEDDSKKESDHYKDRNVMQCQDLVPILWESESEGSCTLYEEGSDDQGIGSNVRVWYNLDIYIHPAEPVNIVEIKCVALEGICFDIPLRNAQEHMINMDVIISNPAFLAPREFTLAPQQCMDYHVRYTPAATGCRKESIIFQPDNFVEFWYLLKFIVDLPTPIVMPEVQCDLGKFVAQTIYLRNPTCETLELQIKNSNPDNFEVKIQTSPFEEWKCLLSGVGLFPQPLEVQKVTTFLHKPISIAIDFENPTKENVFVNILLTNQQVPKKLFLGIQCSSFFAETSAFRLAMTASKGIELSPRMRTRIFVGYNPKIVKIKKTMVVIQMMRANGKNWPIDNFDELPPEMKKLMGVNTGEIHTIRWIYPIIGLPQAKEDQGPPVVITCQAKKLIETNMQVILSGDFVGERPILFTKDFSVVPRRNSYSSYEDVDVLPIRREFEYEFIFESEEEKSFLKPSLDLELINTVYIFNAQLIILDFIVKFSPKKPLRSNIMLKVQCILDGIWNFPVTLVATDPETEDVIHIAGSGLCKESVTELLLLGRKSKAVPFSAYFQPGSDPEFFVRPESGEIPPRDSDGIILLVGFKPQMYGKKYNSKLVVETDDMYYLYEVIGIPEVPTVPPQDIKAKISTTRKKVNKKIIIRHDFVSENINAVKSRVSSTIKHASSVSNNKK